MRSIAAGGGAIEPKMSDLINRLSAQAEAVGTLLREMGGHFCRECGTAERMKRRLGEARESAIEQIQILGEEEGMLRSACGEAGFDPRHGQDPGILVEETSG